MPFTFSHPAIVLPGSYFSKKYISLTGLVVGSITPDFEYFLRMKVYSIYSHTWTGIFWFDLPLATILSFLFHLVIRNKLINNLPDFLRQRLIKFNLFNWINHCKTYPLTIITSMLIRIASHILWDSFTHEQGFFVKNSTLLSNDLKINNINIPLYKILQHGSSLLGGLVILSVILNLQVENSTKTQNSNLSYWLIFLIFISVVVSIRLVGGLNLTHIGDVVITVISAGLMSLLLVSALLKSD